MSRDPIWKDDGTDAPSYGDTMPAFMYPEHHPDYRPYKVPALRRSSCPGAKPFDWRSVCKPYTIAGHCQRLKNHPAAQTWTGSYPDAPPTGQEGRAPAWEPETEGQYVFPPDCGRFYQGADYPRHGLRPHPVLQLVRAA